MRAKLLLILALLLPALAWGAGGLNYPGGLTTQSPSGCVRFDASVNPVTFQSTGLPCNAADTIISKSFSALGTPSNGTIYYCTNCNQATPCTGGGTGAFAERVNGVWQCSSGGGTVAEGFGIDVSGSTVSVAPEELGEVSWGSGPSGYTDWTFPDLLSIITPNAISGFNFVLNDPANINAGAYTYDCFDANNCEIGVAVRSNGINAEVFSTYSTTRQLAVGNAFSTTSVEIRTDGTGNGEFIVPDNSINLSTGAGQEVTGLLPSTNIALTSFSTPTFGDNAGTDTWTWDPGGGANPTMEFSSGMIRFPGEVVRGTDTTWNFLDATNTNGVTFDPATTFMGAIGTGQLLASNVPGPVFNVKDSRFGALGNGSADDTAAVRAAYTAAAAVSGGATIFFPCGTYVLTKPAEAGALRINVSNITVRGASPSCATLTYPNTTTDGALIAICDTAATTCDNITIRDLGFNGNGTNWSATGTHYAILRSTQGTSAHGLIDNVLVQNFGNSTNTQKNPIQLDRLWNDWTISNSTFLGNERGINMACNTGAACKGGRIINNFFDQTGAVATSTDDYNIQTTGLVAAPLSDVLIAHNLCRGSCHGRCITSNASHARIELNEADGCAADQIIATRSSTAATLTDVTMTGNIARNGSDGGFGFETSSTLAGCQSCSFTGNQSINNAIAGLYLVDTTDVSITGNVFDSNGSANNGSTDAAIFFSSPASGTGITRTNIVGNTFTDSAGTPTQKFAIQIPVPNVGVTKTTIAGNTYGPNQAGGAPLSIANSALVTSTSVMESGHLAVAFSELAGNYNRATNGTRLYCTDCTVASTCAGSGTGAIANRVNGAWSCGSVQSTECASASCNLNSATTLNSKAICLADGTNCPAGAAGTTLTADTGGTTTGTSLSVLGDANGIDTTRATDTITVSLDTTELNNETFGNNAAADITWTFDPTGIGNSTFDFLDGKTILTGPRIDLTKNGVDGVTLNSSTGVLSALGSGSVQADDVVCSGCIALGSEVSGTLPTGNGGTGLTTYTQGDIPYYVSGTALSKLAKSATATRYIANTGTSNAPAWAQVDVSNGVTGALPIANGGTNSSTALSGSSIMVSNGSAVAQGAAGTATTLLHGNAAGTPTYSAVSLTADVTGAAPDANVSNDLSLDHIVNQTTNGFVKTNSGSGLLSIDTATYLTAESDPQVSNVTTGKACFGDGTTVDCSTTITGGTGITYSAGDFSVDPTEIGTVTWGSGSNFGWKFNGSAVSNDDPILSVSGTTLAVDNVNSTAILEARNLTVDAVGSTCGVVGVNASKFRCEPTATLPTPDGVLPTTTGLAGPLGTKVNATATPTVTPTATALTPTPTPTVSPTAPFSTPIGRLPYPDSGGTRYIATTDDKLNIQSSGVAVINGADIDTLDVDGSFVTIACYSDANGRNCHMAPGPGAVTTSTPILTSNIPTSLGGDDVDKCLGGSNNFCLQYDTTSGLGQANLGFSINQTDTGLFRVCRRGANEWYMSQNVNCSATRDDTSKNGTLLDLNNGDFTVWGINALTVRNFIVDAANQRVGFLYGATGSATSYVTVGIGSGAAKTFGIDRNTTTTGDTLTVKGGGALSGGTNLAGGNLVLSGGTSTGTGASIVQVQIPDPAATPGSTTDKALKVVSQFKDGHYVVSQTVVPTLSAGCGNTGSVVGTDTTGKITITGTGITGVCTLTFNKAFTTNSPICTAVFSVNGGATFTQMKVTSATTTATFSNFTVTTDLAANYTANDVIWYQCLGYE